MIKHSKDGLVSFDSEKHIYTHKNGEVLQGVTTFISKHKKKFDAENIAISYANKNGFTPKYWVDKWKYKGEISRIHGSAVHSVFENYILYGSVYLFGISEKEKIAEKFIADYFLSGRLLPVESELIIYNTEICLASQIDCIVKDKLGNFFILDWKTNDEVKTSSFRDERMKAPFDLLPDCDFYSYSLQLGIYSLLCKDYDITGCYIVHIGETDYQFIKIYDTPNLGSLLGLGGLDKRYVAKDTKGG